MVNSNIGWMFSGRPVEEQDDEVEFSMLIDENILDVSHFWQLETVGLNGKTEEKETEDLINNYSRIVVDTTLVGLGNYHDMS